VAQNPLCRFRHHRPAAFPHALQYNQGAVTAAPHRPAPRASALCRLLLAAGLAGCALDQRDLGADVASADGGPARSAAGSFSAGRFGSVTITGHVNGGLFTWERPPVHICVHDEPDYGCVDSDEIGAYSIEVPAHSNVALRIEGEGLAPTLRAFVTTDEPIELNNTRVDNEGGLRSVAEGLGVDLDPERGVVYFSGIEYVSAQLEPPSGERFFLNVAGRLLDQAQWVELRGSGGFLNVEPGRTAIRFQHPEGDCAFQPDNTLSGWPHPDQDDVAVVPVLAGHHTSVISMQCK